MKSETTKDINYAIKCFKKNFVDDADVGDTLGFRVGKKHFSIVRDDKLSEET